MTAGIGAVGRGVNECGLIVAATRAIATSAMILRNADLQIEYRGNSAQPERNMIAQRGVGIFRGRLFKCRRLSSALCMPRLDEKEYDSVFVPVVRAPLRRSANTRFFID